MNQFLLTLLIVISTPVFAQPKITAVTPQAGPLGATITVTGTGFDPVATNNIVYLGPVKAPIISATSTTLVIKTPTGTAYAPLTVQSDGLTSYPALPFTLSWPGGNGFNDSSYLYYYSTYSEQRYSSAMAFGDLDGDGFPDLVLNYMAYIGSNPSGPGGITISRNQGISDSVAFTLVDTLATGNTPGSAVIRDLDGDGRPDIVVPNTGDGTVTLLLNNSTVGHISFATPITDTLPGGVSTILLADFNGDGKPDLIADNGSILVFINTSTTGHLSFAKPDTLGSAGSGMAIADFDGDGYPDIVTNTGPGLTFYSWPNKVATYTTSNTGPYLAVGDLDGDGKPDLAASGIGTSGLSINAGPLVVFHNTTTVAGQPNFTELDLPGPAGFYPYLQVQFGDLDGDGKPELATTDGIWAFIFKNTSAADTIGFQPPFLWNAQDAIGVYTGDLHSIGQNDLVYLNQLFGSVNVLKYNMRKPTPPAFRLISFTGSEVDDQIAVQWQVANQGGVADYTLLMGPDTLNLQPFTTVRNNGLDSSSYAETITPDSSGTYYFQLGIIDTAGNITYSGIIPVTVTLPPTLFSVYPNPAHNTLTVTLPANNRPSTIRVVDITGFVVLQTAVADGTTEVTLDLTQLTTGVYLLSWISPTATRHKLILVIK
jgi:hypothetical protein